MSAHNDTSQQLVLRDNVRRVAPPTHSPHLNGSLHSTHCFVFNAYHSFQRTEQSGLGDLNAITLDTSGLTSSSAGTVSYNVCENGNSATDPLACDALESQVRFFRVSRIVLSIFIPER